MSIAKLGEKGKLLVENNAIYASIVVIIVGMASFGLGRLSAPENRVESVAIENPYPSSELVLGGGESVLVSSEEGKFVASRSGTKYHFPWCSGAKRIKEENKLWFVTKEDAEAAGYEPAKNCKGL